MFHLITDMFQERNIWLVNIELNIHKQIFLTKMLKLPTPSIIPSTPPGALLGFIIQEPEPLCADLDG